MEEMTEEMEVTIIDQLNDLHHDLVGETIDKTDLDKIIGILLVLAEKVEELNGHSHTIS